MDTLAPAIADAFELLRQDLCQRLDDAESSSLSYQDWDQEDIDTAREVIPHLVLVLRGLLLDHQMRPNGDCRTCTSAWPCPVVAMMHGLLKDPEDQFVTLARRVYEAQ
ncbi:MAG: hypothetical protein JO309_15150 [Pseudonocardiales bacterium]|nr:hypothetical protein [Pseudonocardiales bacterium]MBV9730707.1 hypothetical protein [Pseudonocardiales bacterium]